MTMKRRVNQVIRSGVAAAIAALALASVRPSMAAPYTWGNAAGNWSAAGSWTPSGPPLAADTAVFSGAGQTVTIDGTQSIAAFQATGSGAWTWAGSGAGTLNLSGPLSYGSSGASTFSAVLAGTGSLAVASGTLTLSAANTFSGGTTLSAGTLSIGNNAALGTGTLTLNGGALADGGNRTVTNAAVINGDFSLARTVSTLTLSGPVTLNKSGWVQISIDDSTGLTLSGPVTEAAGTCGLRLVSINSTYPGTMTLSVSNNFTGGILTTGSDKGFYLNGGHNNAFGTGSITVSNAWTRIYASGGNWVFPNEIIMNGEIRCPWGSNATYPTLAGNVTVGGNYNWWVGGAGWNSNMGFLGALLHGPGGLYTMTLLGSATHESACRFEFLGSNKIHQVGLNVGSGAGMYVYGATNTFSQPVTVIGGTLTVAGFNNIFSNQLNVVAGTATLNGTAVTAGPLTVHPGVTLTAAAAGNFTAGQSVTIMGDALCMGVLSLAYNAAPPALGATSSGVLALDVVGNCSQALDMATLGDGTMFLGSTAASVTTYTADTLGAGSNSTYRLGGGGGTLTLDVPSSTTGALTGGNDLIVGRNGGGVNFAGSVTTKDNNAFTGSITVNNGSTLKALLTDLPAGAVTPFGGNTGGAITLNGGTLAIDKGTASPGARTVTKGAMTFTGSSTVSLTGDATHAVQLTVDTLTRDTTYGAGLIVSAASGLGSNEKFIVSGGGPARIGSPGALGNNMVDPHMVYINGQFLDYSAPNGFAASGYDYPWTTQNGGLIGANDIVQKDAGTATMTNDVTCKAIAFHTSTANVALNGSGKLIIASGGLTVNIETVKGIDMSVPIQFGLTGSGEGSVYTVASGGGGAGSISGDIIGNGLTKFGPGSWYLTKASTAYSLTGTVTAASGSIYWDPNNNANPLANIAGYVLNGGTLYCGGGNGGRTMSITKQVTVGPQGGTITCAQGASAGNSLAISGNIVAGSPQSGLLTLANDNPSNAGTISGANTHNGGTLLQGTSARNGSFTVSSTSSLGTGPVTVASTAALVLQGDANIATNAAVTISGTANFQSAAPAVGSLSGVGTLYLGPSSGSGTTTLTFGGDNSSTEFYGSIQNGNGSASGYLVKVGAGTFLMNGTMASGSGGVTNLVGTFGGSGTISRPVTIAGGSILAPGNSGIGTLTVGGLTLLAGCMNLFEIGTTNASDKIVVNGNLTLAGTFSVTNAPTFGGKGMYPIMTYTGTLTDNGTTTTAFSGYKGRVVPDPATRTVWLDMIKRTGFVVFIK